MSARVLLAAAAVGATAALLASGAAPLAQSPSKRCEIISGRVITANQVAVVYRKGPPDQYTVFACVQKTGQVRRIGSWTDVEYGEYGFNLGGKYLAYATAICSHGADCVGRPHVRNLATGTLRNGSQTPGASTDVNPRASRSGSMAWLRVKPGGSVGTLRSLEPSGERVLDSGPGIASNSLALAGRTLYWLHDGAPRARVLE